MDQTVKVQTRGRITLPQEVRDALHAETGDEVILRKTAPGRFELKVRRRTAALEKARPSRLAVAVPSNTEQLDLPL